MQSSRSYLKSILAVVLMVFSATVFAVPIDDLPVTGPADLIVKTSTGKGTYFQMFDQITKVCTTPTLVNSPSGGTLESLDDMMNNRANLAFLPTDVLYSKKTIENDPLVDNLRIFMPLYMAELHIVANTSNYQVTKFSDLSNKKIGVYGASYVTSRIIFAKTGIRPISLDNYKSEDDALNALAQNKIDAVFIVVGQPAKWASDLKGNQYKLLAFDRMDILQKTRGYVQTVLRYPNLSSVAVPTIGTRINLVTYNYESPKKIKDLTALRNCIANNIADLRETTGNHPKWREVNPLAEGDWTMFKFAGTPSSNAIASSKSGSKSKSKHPAPMAQQE